MPSLCPLCPQPSSLSRAAWSLRRQRCGTRQAARLEWGMQGSGGELSVLPTTTEICYAAPSFLAGFIELDAI